MQFNTTVTTVTKGVEAQNIASGCTIEIKGDKTKMFITVQTNETPFDLPACGTAKVCDISLEFPYSSDDIRYEVRPYNRAADAIAMKGEAESGNGFELNTYTQLPPNAVLIYAVDATEIIEQ